MNEYERQRRIAESTKKLYPHGTRIELLHMDDPYAPVPPGTRGTVKFVDSMGTIFPEWDNGRTFGVVLEEDFFIACYRNFRIADKSLYFKVVMCKLCACTPVSYFTLDIRRVPTAVQSNDNPCINIVMLPILL